MVFQIGKDLDGGVILHLLGREGAHIDASGRRGADRRLLDQNRAPQSRFAGGVLPLAIDHEADNQHHHDGRDGAIAQDLLFVLFEKTNCMFDFQRKLIRFQFFPGDSCQTKNLKCKGTISWYHGLCANGHFDAP